MTTAGANVKVLATAIDGPATIAMARGNWGMMERHFGNTNLDGESNRRPAALWRRAARLALAALCMVVASLAGVASGRVSLAQIGAVPGTVPSADAPRDSARNLLRPHAEIVAKAPTWRAVDASGPQPDPHSGAILAPRRSVAGLAGSELRSVSDHDHEPRWLAVRAGFSRAPPMAIGRSRTAA
jgi:hypothetical protein